MPALTQSDIRRLFELLNQELAASSTHAELFLVGGASCVSLTTLDRPPRMWTPCSGPAPKCAKPQRGSLPEWVLMTIGSMTA